MKQPKTARILTDRHLENFGEMIRLLLEEEQLTDVTLHCKDGTLKAHKLVLAASSPYFRKILVEHNKENVALIMHGISREKLKKVIEVIYYGCADIPTDTVDSMCDLIDELDLAGVVVVNDNSDKEGRTNGYGRDTRFKGQKRVAVDFNESDNDVVPSKITKSERNSCDRKSLSQERRSPDKRTSDVKKDSESASDVSTSIEGTDANELYTVVKEELITPTIPNMPMEPKLSSWDKKPRKFMCELCTSSFKRASHLTRHQLVHTGERPYACKYCDKAFSRHDKLKHHVRKNHDLDTEVIPKESSSTDAPYSIGTVRVPSPVMNKSGNYEDKYLIYASNYSTYSNLESATLTPPTSLFNNSTTVKDATSTSKSSITTSTPKISNISNVSSTSVSSNGTPLQKKGRGRPRKYPPAPPQLVKRPRGRPRLNPIGILPQVPGRVGQNYDITNLPFGDLEYLTKPIQDHLDQSMDDSEIIEPLVEIKMEGDSENMNSSIQITEVKTVTDHSPNNEDKDSCDPMGLLEPVVSISETELDKTSQRSPTIPSEESEKTEDPMASSISFLSGIGLYENKSGKIGECTISVADQ